MKVVDDFFEYLGILLLLINVFLYIKGCRGVKKSTALNYFKLYLIFCFVIQFTVFTLALYDAPNLYLSHFYFIGQFAFLSLFYKKGFNANQKKGVNIIFIIVLLTLGIQYATNPELFYKFNIFEVFVTSFPLVIYSIIHLYNSLSSKSEFMYINAGVLMYITTSTLIFILGDYLSNFKNDSIISIWFLNKVLYVGYLLLILIEWKQLNSQLKNKS